MTARARCVCALVVLAASGACPAAAQQPPVAFPDSLGAWTPTRSGGAFESVSRADYLRAHAFSLDNYLEFAPGGVLVRPGPIGFVTGYSRWGIGRGRAALSINGISFNDPQNGLAPWVDVATSGLGRLDMDNAAWSPTWIEGNLALVTAPPATSRPTTYVELSKGTNDLRQRRVQFGSEEGKVGLDLSYDEVLDDGYGFDASGALGAPPDYGKARSRNSSIVLRGAPDDRGTFTFGFRQYESNTSGDLVSVTAEGARSGHLAWLDAAAGDTRLTVYGRGFNASAPDSETVNETSGVAVETSLGGDAREVRVRVTAEETSFSQEVGGVYAARLVGGRAVLSARSRIGDTAELFASGSAVGDEASDVAWGLLAGVRRTGPRHILSAQAGRSSRVPTLAERYLPAHDSGGFTLAGDNGVNPEHALEVRADWEQRSHWFVNNLRASWMSAERTIAFLPRDVGGTTWRVATNGEGTQSMWFAEERFRSEFQTGPLRALGEGAVLFTTGDREQAFASVPDVQVNASLLIGGEMFNATSALYVGAEYTHMGSREDYDGRALAAYDVLNLTLHARLVDAHFYLRYINVLDEAYQTYQGYLMTPATFVYGIEWTLFN
ncbi:MAG: hypothetical protein OEX18_04960 [Candidatus Krumholzibacteria bacterium]|nr:hypothetical protein [Candidatus Krumholzibacteria bacterium]MDH4336610.1 hypothetical protein [Candidatus Krumholzibacteria bacterium]MDH5268953.1 hypothetical protein [Candidatus Krumholzibacteria bacterium]